jgi:2-iminoacetate synthase ThiH
MTEHEIEALIERAAERGARKALADVGLHDEDAGRDVQELRGLLEAWRATRRTILQTITRLVTTAILSALAAVAYLHFTNKSQ